MSEKGNSTFLTKWLNKKEEKMEKLNKKKYYQSTELRKDSTKQKETEDIITMNIKNDDKIEEDIKIRISKVKNKEILNSYDSNKSNYITLDKINPNEKSETTKKRKWYSGMTRPIPPNLGKVPIPIGPEGCLSGKRFVITGTLDSLERDDAKNLIEKYEGKVTTAVSGLTNFLIIGNEPGLSKVKKAKDKGITSITEKELFEMITSGKKSKNNKNKKGNKILKSQKNKEFKKTDKISSPIIKKNKEKNNFVLWTEKYKPTDIKDLVGNTKEIKRLYTFLKNWKKENKKAILLSGAPGIGKTSSVYVIAKKLSYEILEMNASDTRSKSLLQKKIQETLNNNSIRSYLKNNDVIRSRVILMDEVDGMSSGDRGGVAELIKFIKKTKYPIVCTCNDQYSLKIRSLKSYCLTVSFKAPTLMQITTKIKSIAHSENLMIEDSLIKEIVMTLNFDLRNIINTLQLFKNSQKSMKNMKLKKDITKTFWEGGLKLFSGIKTNMSDFIAEGIDFYFIDQMMSHLLIQENYLRYKSTNFNIIEPYTKASEFLADSDIINNVIVTEQNYSFMPLHAIMSCVAPSYCVSKYRGPFRLMFPSILSKISQLNKNKRCVLDLEQHLNLKIKNISRKGLVQDYLFFLYHYMVDPLICQKIKGVNVVLERIKNYFLTKEDWDFLYILGNFKKENYAISSQVKSSLTRSYNKTDHNIFSFNNSGLLKTEGVKKIIRSKRLNKGKSAKSNKRKK